MTQVGDGGIAVQDLQDEKLQGNSRSEETFAPGIAGRVADLLDALGVEVAGQVIRDLSESLCGSKIHGSLLKKAKWR